MLTILCVNMVVQHHEHLNLFKTHSRKETLLAASEDLTSDNISSILIKMERSQKRLFELISQLDLQELELSKDWNVNWGEEMASLYQYIQLRRAIYIAIKNGIIY